MSHPNVHTLSWFNLVHLEDNDCHHFGTHAGAVSRRPVQLQTIYRERPSPQQILLITLSRKPGKTSLTDRGQCIGSIHSRRSFNPGNEPNIVIVKPNHARLLLEIIKGILNVTNWTRFNERDEIFIVYLFVHSSEIFNELD